MIIIPLLQTAILLSSYTVYGMAETMNNTCEKACAIGKKPTTLVLDPSPSTNNLLSGLFLNIHYQAPCSGKVVAWEFCYHIYSLDMPEEQDHNNVTEIQAGVWSRGQNNLEYHLKKNSLTNLNISIPNSDLQFACYRRDLLHGATIEVEEGDIVGVFVSGTNMVTVLSESEQDNGILRANIPSIESLVLKSELSSTTYSLYLEAVVKGEKPPDAPVGPHPSGHQNEKLQEYIVIGVLAASIVLLIITIVVTIGRLYCLRQSSKSSVPVLIKKMKTGNQKVTRILMVSEEAGQHIDYTETEQEEDEDPQHPTASSEQPPSPLSNQDGSRSSSEQGEYESPMSPPPVVFAASFDIDQQSEGDHERFIFNPSHLKHSCTKPQKIANSDLKRSHSAADAINVAYSTSTDANSCPYTASTEYPYVLHAFEVVGKNQTHIGSLPNIIEYRFSENQATNPASDEENNRGGTAHFQMDTADDSNSDSDDEPTYSYADRRQMTADNLPTRRSRLPSIAEQATNQDYHYDEYPSDWNPTSQIAVQSDTQSSCVYTTIDHNQSTEFSALPSNQVSPTQDLNQSSNMQDNTPSPKPKLKKPTIKPRKKLAYKVTSNSAALHSPVGVDITEKSCQPSEMMSCYQMTENPSNTEEVDTGAMLIAKTPPKYMKLLETTKDEFHRYTYLFDGMTEMDKLTVSDHYPERAHPNEWCKQTKC